MSQAAIIWARPLFKEPTTFCAVMDTRGGSTIAYCRGRWASFGDSVEWRDEPTAAERCLKCGGCLVALGMCVELGLAELRDAPAIDMRPLVEIGFDEVEG